ncbi:MAG: acyltransferase [Nevskia sp.]|nr:acyltransferase [Nevskia sp.]
MIRRHLPAALIGVLTGTAMILWLLLSAGLILLPLAILKTLLPVPPLQRWLLRAMVWIAGVYWVGGNSAIYTALHGPRSGYRLDAALDPQSSWLIVSNHQSWADILILFDAFRGRVPFPRFFLKKELIWIPLVGFLCWALDMPFMQRHSRAAVAANPNLKNEDLETTRRFCEKYRQQPITVVNFVEGTRGSAAKRIARQSPYAHLLRPKSAGLSFMLNAMGEQFAGMIDVTLVYQAAQRPKIWSFLCGEQTAVELQAQLLPLPAELLHGDYADDAAFRERFQHWVNQLWAQKDQTLSQKLGGRAA